MNIQLCVVGASQCYFAAIFFFLFFFLCGGKFVLLLLLLLLIVWLSHIIFVMHSYNFFLQRYPSRIDPE